MGRKDLRGANWQWLNYVELLFPRIFSEYLSGGFKYFLMFDPCLGKITIFTHIFVQLGWNHQLGGRRRLELTFGRNMPDQHTMGVSLNGGTPISRPKMIIFSRKTHSCWVPPYKALLNPYFSGGLTLDHWVEWPAIPGTITYLPALNGIFESMIFRLSPGYFSFLEGMYRYETHIVLYSVSSFLLLYISIYVYF